MFTTQTYRVSGMTCGHCVAAVEQEIDRIAGVSDVVVDLASGQVTVTSSRPLTTDELVAAVDEAGYELAG
jgi:copper ion binding protein